MIAAGRQAPPRAFRFLYFRASAGHTQEAFRAISRQTARPRSGGVCVEKGHAYNTPRLLLRYPTLRRLFLQIDMRQIFHRKPQKPRSHLPEFLRRIRRKKLEVGNASPLALD